MNHALLVGIVCLGCVAVAPLMRYSPVLVNYTASLPVGLYWKTDDPKAPDVIFCLDRSAESTAGNLGIRLNGSCPDGSMPEMKRLYVASPESPAVFTPHGFIIGGKLLRNTAPLDKSPSGKPLTHYPFGRYTSGDWAISSYAALSFDSRYFGPVHQIVGRARPLWTLE